MLGRFPPGVTDGIHRWIFNREHRDVEVVFSHDTVMCGTRANLDAAYFEAMGDVVVVQRAGVPKPAGVRDIKTVVLS